MKYVVKFPTHSIQKRFQRTLEKIYPQNVREEIMDAVESLGDNPRPSGGPKIKPPLIVYHFTAQYRIRVRNYRVLYDVDDKDRVVWILDLRKRSERTYQ